MTYCDPSVFAIHCGRKDCEPCNRTSPEKQSGCCEKCIIYNSPSRKDYPMGCSNPACECHLKNGLVGELAGYRIHGKSYDADGNEIKEAHPSDCFCCRKHLLAPEKQNVAGWEERLGAIPNLEAYYGKKDDLAEFIRETVAAAKREAQQTLLERVREVIGQDMSIPLPAKKCEPMEHSPFWDGNAYTCGHCGEDFISRKVLLTHLTNLKP